MLVQSLTFLLQRYALVRKNVDVLPHHPMHRAYQHVVFELDGMLSSVS